MGGTVAAHRFVFVMYWLLSLTLVSFNLTPSRHYYSPYSLVDKKQICQVKLTNLLLSANYSTINYRSDLRFLMPNSPNKLMNITPSTANHDARWSLVCGNLFRTTVFFVCGFVDRWFSESG